MENIYTESIELKSMTKKMIEWYWLHISHVDIDNIFFAEIQEEKPKKAPIMFISGIKTKWVRQLLSSHPQYHYMYCIMIYKNEWDELYPVRKEWMLFDALLRIHPANNGSLRQPDVNDFGIILEYLGIYWRNKDNLPSLLQGDKPLPIPSPLININENISETDWG